jgi:hypothetical protein
MAEIRGANHHGRTRGQAHLHVDAGGQRRGDISKKIASATTTIPDQTTMIQRSHSHQSVIDGLPCGGQRPRLRQGLRVVIVLRVARGGILVCGEYEHPCPAIGSRPPRLSALVLA